MKWSQNIKAKLEYHLWFPAIVWVLLCYCSGFLWWWSVIPVRLICLEMTQVCVFHLTFAFSLSRLLFSSQGVFHNNTPAPLPVKNCTWHCVKTIYWNFCFNTDTTHTVGVVSFPPETIISKNKDQEFHIIIGETYIVFYCFNPSMPVIAVKDRRLEDALIYRMGFLAV